MQVIARVNLAENSSVHSESFHLSQCCLECYHNLEILRLYPQREFPSLYISSSQLVIGLKSFPHA